MTFHWHSPTHDYSAMLEADLFGGWTLVTSSGAHQGGVGRLRRKQFASYAEGVAALRRLRRRHRLGGDALCGGTFTAIANLDPRGTDHRAASANAVARVFAGWGLAVAEQAALLGIGIKDMERYLDGLPLANDAALLGRVADILAIHKVLRLRYGGDATRSRAWLREPCVVLGGRAPLAWLLANPSGLAAARRDLEREADAARIAQTTSA